MTAIFHVATPLKYNGTNYPAGSFVEAELDALRPLVDAGVLVPVPGAKNASEAQAILDQRAADTAQLEAQTQAAEPKDTWGPQAPTVEEPEQEQTTDDTQEQEPTAPQEPEQTEQTDDAAPTTPEDETGDNL